MLNLVLPVAGERLGEGRQRGPAAAEEEVGLVAVGEEARDGR